MTLPAKPDFIRLSVFDDAEPIVGDLFKRKFAQPFPVMQHDLVAFFQADDNVLVPLSYSKFVPCGSVLLVGGCCTDGRAFSHMTDEQKQTLTAAGGSMAQLLRWGFTRFADQCDAYFGYCGDARAWEVDLSAGFVPTEHDKLLVHWHKPLDEKVRRALVAMAHALGPF
ncbi:MAG: hypothetical protein ABJB01_01550 [Rudaea sp.]